jgi:glyoxalase family protein
MAHLVSGLHHLTSCVAGAQEDIDFFTKLIGQRMVKQTVLFDGTLPIYHLYYGNAQAEPGSIMTTFPFKQAGIYARKGSGQVKVTGYSVPTASLGFWVERFNQHGVKNGGIASRFGQQYVHFDHPSGLEFEMIGDDNDDREPWSTSEVPAAMGVRGLHTITLSLRETAESERFMIDGLGFRKTGEEGAYTRFEIGKGGAGCTIDFLHEPDLPAGSWTFGVGTVHHVAFAVQNDEEQAKVKAYLEGMGYTDVSESKDRNYFHSIYVRMPGGVLFEIATTDIGFATDEPLDQLGKTLLLPPWFEDRREEIVAPLEPISIPAEASGR